MRIYTKTGLLAFLFCSKLVFAEGMITVNAIPWGNVWIDGKAMGVTPLVKHSLPEGPHILEIRHVDYEPFKSNIDVAAYSTIYSAKLVTLLDNMKFTWIDSKNIYVDKASKGRHFYRPVMANVSLVIGPESGFSQGQYAEINKRVHAVPNASDVFTLAYTYPDDISIDEILPNLVEDLAQLKKRMTDLRVSYYVRYLNVTEKDKVEKQLKRFESFAKYAGEVAIEGY